MAKSRPRQGTAKNTTFGGEALYQTKIAESQFYDLADDNHLYHNPTVQNQATARENIASELANGTHKEYNAHNQKQPIDIYYDESEFGQDQNAVKETMYDIDKRERYDRHPTAQHPKSQTWRHKTKNRQVLSEVTVFATETGDRVEPFPVRLTTACAPNFKNQENSKNPSSLEDVKTYISNRQLKTEEYYNTMKLLFKRALKTQDDQGTEVFILPLIGGDVYLQRLEKNAQSKAKDRICLALRHALEELQRDKSLKNIKEVVFCCPKKGITTNDHYNLVHDTFSPLTFSKSLPRYTGSPAVTVTDAGMLEAARQAYKNGAKNIGILNAGSDRTIGGAYAKWNNRNIKNKQPFPPAEECLFTLTNAAYVQPYKSNPNQQLHFSAYPKALHAHVASTAQPALVSMKQDNQSWIPTPTLTASQHRKDRKDSSILPPASSSSSRIDKKDQAPDQELFADITSQAVQPPTKQAVNPQTAGQPPLQPSSLRQPRPHPSSSSSVSHSANVTPLDINELNKENAELTAQTQQQPSAPAPLPSGNATGTQDIGASPLPQTTAMNAEKKEQSVANTQKTVENARFLSFMQAHANNIKEKTIITNITTEPVSGSKRIFFENSTQAAHYAWYLQQFDINGVFDDETKSVCITTADIKKMVNKSTLSSPQPEGQPAPMQRNQMPPPKTVNPSLNTSPLKRRRDTNNSVDDDKSKIIAENRQLDENANLEMSKVNLSNSDDKKEDKTMQHSPLTPDDELKKDEEHEKTPSSFSEIPSSPPPALPQGRASLLLSLDERFAILAARAAYRVAQEQAAGEPSVYHKYDSNIAALSGKIAEERKNHPVKPEPQLPLWLERLPPNAKQSTPNAGTINADTVKYTLLSPPDRPPSPTPARPPSPARSPSPDEQPGSPDKQPGSPNYQPSSTVTGPKKK
ncbi:MAG TPA: hypothetical protein VHZ76_04110 [Gammaproteobacteria bacterium]|jgi:hypothetical protein|nr:hypothetical protein [Gammaproteobacteria bacterium]